MKKIFLICLLILATQFVFASLPIWWDSDKSNINKKTVDLGAIYNSDKGKDTVDLNFRDISTDKPNNPVNDNQLRDFCYNNLDYSTDNTNNKPVNAAGKIFANYFNWFPTGIQDKDPIEAYAPMVLSISTFDTNSITGDIHRDNNSYYNFSTGMEGKDNVDLIRIRGKQLSAEQKNAKLERELILIILHTPGNTENNDSKYLKIKKVIKEKLHDLICWSPDEFGD